jgi:hypothetical protein
MQKLCPQCRKSFAGHFLCPHCGVQLLGPTDPAILYPSPTARLRSATCVEPDLPTLWGRLLVGLVLAQGLYYCGRQLSNAAFLAAGDPDWTAGTRGLALLETWQALGLLVGGAIAGAGQVRATLVGALLGLFNAGLLMLVQWVLEKPSTDLQLYGLPVFHAAIGTLGGLVGRWVWKPMPPLPAFGLVAAVATPLPPEPVVTEPGPPWAWGRLLLGAAIAVGGALGADFLRTLLTTVSSGRAAIAGGQQAQFLTWQIAVLMVVCGGALAGAGTGRGFSQGLVVGLVTCLTLGGVYFSRGLEVLPGQEAVCDLLGLPVQRGRMSPQMVAFLFAGTILAGALGGWLGGQLLPPLGPGRRKHSIYDEASV